MTISPSNPAVGDTLYCSWDYFDQDNDADQTTYWWYANGTYLSNWSNSPLNTSSLQVGSQIYCAGDAYDGVNWGNTISSQNVTLGSPTNSTGSGNNSSNNTSGCGTNASNVWFEVEPYQQEWNASDTVSVYLDTYCGIWNNSYMVSWGLIDNATNSIIDYGNTSFVTNTSSVSYHPNHTFHFNEFDIHLYYMETGNYTVFGQFYVWMNNSWALLSNESSSFEVNSTMTTTVCGFNSTFIDMETDMQSTFYYADSSVHPWSDIECPMLNTPYTYTWEMYNLNTSTVTHSGLQNFTATWQNVNMFTDGSGFFYDLYPHAYNLTEGAYLLNTTLLSASGDSVDTSNVSFSVWAASSNNTGACGNDTSLTDLWASTDSSTWGTWTNAVYGYFNINCTIPGKNYTLEVTLNDSTGWSSYSFWNWTETNDYEYRSEAWSNLSAGGYCVNATLWDVSSPPTYHYVDSDYPCFTLSTNNTGNNNTWDIPVITHIDSNTGWPYYEGDVFEILSGESFEWDVSMTNLTVGEEYRLTVTIENQNGADSVSLGNKMFNATSDTATVMSEHDSYQYPQGCYWANVEVIMQPESLGISDNFDFVIDVDYSNCSSIGNNNTGGNNTGGNTGNNTVGNNTGDNTGNNTGDNTGGNNTGDNTGNNTGDNTGGNNTGGNTGNNTGDNTGGNNTNGIQYNIFNIGPEDCVQSGDELHVTMIVYAGPNQDHTLDWQIVAANGVVVTSWHSQDVTTSSNGSAIFNWALDTTNLSDGSYYLRAEDPVTGVWTTWFWFEVGCTGCGYDSSLTNLNYQIWSENFGTIFSTWNASINSTSTSSNSVNDDLPQIIAGSYIGFWGQIECIELDQSYLLNYTVTNSANLFVMGGEEYFNSSGSTWYWFDESNISTTLLPADEYCITVTLYVSPYGSSDIMVTYTDCVEIVALEDWDGCGSNLTYLEHLQTVSGNPFVQQNVVFLTTSNIWVNNFVDCLVIGESYTMETVVTSDGNPYLQFSDSFTVNQFSDITQWDWQTISDWQNDIATGNYCVETTIYSTDSTYSQQIATVSSLTDCFAVVNATIENWWDNQDNGTGNGSGTPNDPVLPDTNCSELNGTLSGLNLTNSWNIADCENGTGFWFNLTVNGTGVTWYDPIYAVGYDYEVISGPKFSSVVVPPGYGDDKYDIYLWDGTEYVLAESDLDALTEYWFTDDGGISTTPGDYDGISKFSIRGLEISEKLDPEDPDAFVTGLSFVQDPNEIGEVILSMNPITVSDEDDDGIIDEEDNCVNTENSNQADSDGDGVGDACEESQEASDIDDNDSDSDGGTNVANIIAIFTVCLVFVVLFMRGGGNDGEDAPQEVGKNYYPFDQ
jgi:hypothetical protein